MKIIAKNLKQGEIKLKIDTPEDLWHLSQLIDNGDIIKGKTTRKMKTTEEGDATKKTIIISITVEKVEYSKSTNALRINGKIEEGPEDVPKGSYQTIPIEPNSTLVIKKEHWYDYQLKRLKEATETTALKVLICVFDREDAYFALMKHAGAELLSHISGDVASKRMTVKIKTPFYEQITKQLEEYNKRYNLDHIILASPSFWKEELYKTLKNETLRKKIIQATCSSADERAIDEVLKRDEVRTALQQQRATTELILVEEILTAISKDGPVAYGISKTKEAADAGAIKTLAVTDGLIQQRRQDETFDELNTIMKTVDKQKGTVTIISSDNDGGKKLDGIGGIAALLRYKIAS